MGKINHSTFQSNSATIRDFVDSITFHITYTIFYLISLLPLSVLHRISSLNAFILYRIVAYRKDVVIQNLSRAFPEKKYEEISYIAKRFYVSLSDTMIETIKLCSASRESLYRRIVFQGLDQLEEAVREGNSVLLCLGHLHNWELLSIFPENLNCEVYPVYKALSSKTMNKLMIKIRSRFGGKLVPHTQIAKILISRSVPPAVYLFLADQCPPNVDERYRINFLNQPTLMLNGIEKIWERTKTKLFYLHISNKKRGHYVFRCVGMDIEDKDKGNHHSVISRYATLLEENILEQPHAWLWSHKRWKR